MWTIAGLAGNSAHAAGRLRDIAEEIVDAAGRGEIIAYVDADRRFHLELLGLAGNAHLVDVVRKLRDRARIYRVTEPTGRRELGPSAREHLELLDLIMAGRAADAEDLMRRHLGHVRGAWVL